MHPLHEKMINNIQHSTENNFNNYPDNQVPIDSANTNPYPEIDPNVSSFYEPAITADSITSIQHEWIKNDDSVKNPPGPEEISLGMEQMQYGNNNMEPAVISSLVHSDHQMDGFLGNYRKTSVGNDLMSQVNQQHQMMLDFDCFKGILDESSSWDDSSNSVNVQAGGITFQDYEAGYNHL